MFAVFGAIKPAKNVVFFFAKTVLYNIRRNIEIAVTMVIYAHVN